MAFLEQQFRFENGNTWFWGEQTEHNHKKSNEFSKAAVDWLVENARWPKKQIEVGKFTSNNSTHHEGKELKWNGSAWTKV